jgi:hypothetical protein
MFCPVHRITIDYFELTQKCPIKIIINKHIIFRTLWVNSPSSGLCTLFFVVKFRRTCVSMNGAIKSSTNCFPVHNSFGRIKAGGGSWIRLCFSLILIIEAAIFCTSDLVIQ